MSRLYLHTERPPCFYSNHCVNFTAWAGVDNVTRSGVNPRHSTQPPGNKTRETSVSLEELQHLFLHKLQLPLYIHNVVFCSSSSLVCSHTFAAALSLASPLTSHVHTHNLRTGSRLVAFVLANKLHLNTPQRLQPTAS